MRLVHAPGALLHLALALPLACDERAIPRPRARDTTRANPGYATPAELPRPLPGALARCIARLRSETPRELAGALATLDQDSLYEDACRLELAVELHAPPLCEELHLGPLRDPCAARAAMAAGAPERCPPARAARGRDPTCVAIAARDASLCTAAGPSERVRCVALARGSIAPCAALDPLLRPTCVRDVSALRGALPTLRGIPRREGTAQLTLELGPAGGGTPRSDALDDFARGVFLDTAGTLWLADPVRGYGRRYAAELPVPEARIPLGGARPRGPLAVSARLLLPGLEALDTATPSVRATVTLDAIPGRRGARVAGELALQGASSGLLVRARLRFDTFVRDVVPPATLP